jgi:hypothetical protein
MQTASLHGGRWSSLYSRLSEVADLAATARPFGAFQRPRKVRNVEELLRLIFLYGPAHSSLHSTAAAADEARMACLSDKGDGPATQVGEVAGAPSGVPVARQTGPHHGRDRGGFGSGSGGWFGDLRAWQHRHDLVLTQGTLAERGDRTQITAGQTMIQDRGYARVRDFVAVQTASSCFAAMHATADLPFLQFCVYVCISSDPRIALMMLP